MNQTQCLARVNSRINKLFVCFVYECSGGGVEACAKHSPALIYESDGKEKRTNERDTQIRSKTKGKKTIKKYISMVGDKKSN